MWAEHVVQGFHHLADAQILDLVDGGGEVLPEIAQHLAPFELVVGNEIELFLKVGGEVVFDVALEEAFQEGDDETALVLGNEALLVEAHILAIAQHGERRGIGRGAADAQLFHALDQRCLGETWRRLGEVLCRIDTAIAQFIAGGKRGQQTAVFIFGIIIAAF